MRQTSDATECNPRDLPRVTLPHSDPDIMAGEIFNPNPVVFSASKNSGRKADVSLHSLWMDDTSQFEDETDEVEAIDQDEIFGMLTKYPNHISALTVYEQISFA